MKQNTASSLSLLGPFSLFKSVFVQSKEVVALKEQELERNHKEVDRQAQVIFARNQLLTDVKARLEEARRARKFEGEETQSPKSGKGTRKSRGTRVAGRERGVFGVSGGAT